MKENRLSINTNARNTTILLDGDPLFFKDGFMGYKYVKNVDGQQIYEHMKKMDDKYLSYFLDDINEQLENGVDRNYLTINIPEICIRIGNKIFDI